MIGVTELCIVGKNVSFIKMFQLDGLTNRNDRTRVLLFCNSH